MGGISGHSVLNFITKETVSLLSVFMLVLFASQAAIAEELFLNCEGQEVSTFSPKSDVRTISPKRDVRYIVILRLDDRPPYIEINGRRFTNEESKTRSMSVAEFPSEYGGSDKFDYGTTRQLATFNINRITGVFHYDIANFEGVSEYSLRAIAEFNSSGICHKTRPIF